MSKILFLLFSVNAFVFAKTFDEKVNELALKIEPEVIEWRH